MFVRTKEFCSGLLRHADMRQNVRARWDFRMSARRSNPEQTVKTEARYRQKP